MKKTEGPRSWQTEEELFKELYDDLMPGAPKLTDQEVSAVMARAKAKPRPTADDRRAARMQWEWQQANLPQARRQAAIDAVWAATLAERERLAAEDRRTCHRGRGDADWDERELDDPMGVWRKPR